MRRDQLWEDATDLYFAVGTAGAKVLRHDKTTVRESRGTAAPTTRKRNL